MEAMSPQVRLLPAKDPICDPRRPTKLDVACKETKKVSVQSIKSACFLQYLCVAAAFTYLRSFRETLLHFISAGYYSHIFRKPQKISTMTQATAMSPSSDEQGVLPVVSLQSKDHEELLNIIDKLRSQGISRYIDLPQLIVCGDQSSGKSSVLEAVSGLRFPTKDNLCTRFATELILRRVSTESATVTIVPDPSRSEQERAELLAFKAPSTVDEDFGSIIEAAGKAMGLGPAKVFSTDILRVEISGPTQPHLTLVDLPGLFHAGNKAQSEKDAESVKSLVTSYMKKSRSIILAVVSAKNDYANQIVTKYARDFDKDGDRTLGIITKPDTLHAGSDSERQFFELAENKDVSFRLGWHVLKNRDYQDRDCTAAERDVAEEKFFARGIWTSLSPNQMGIGSLKPRLSRVLKDQILSELPGLIYDVENGINDCKSRLDRLGGSRASKQEQRLYLHAVSQDFSELIKSSVKGMYEGPFFGDPTTDEGYAKRLRAVAQNSQLEFANEMLKKGHFKQIVEEKPEIPSKAPPFKVTRDERLKDVSMLMKRTRGCELPGTFKPEIIGNLFQDQCKPWKRIINGCAELLFDAARTVVFLALEYTADQATSDGILRFIVNPALESMKSELDRKATQILVQHQHHHPITFNHYLTDNMQKARHNHSQKLLAAKLTTFFGADPLSEYPTTTNCTVNTKHLLDALTKETEADMEIFACSEALDCMEAYYKVAMKFVVDDFGIHTIEECLLKKLPDIFTPATVISLDDSVIENIAAESEESIVERASCMGKLEILERALSVLHRLDRHNPRTIKVFKKEKGDSADDDKNAHAETER